MSYLIGIMEYLDAQGTIAYDPTGISGNAFLDTLPESSETVVMFRHGGGFPGDRGLGYDRPSFQVLARGTQDPRTALTLLEAIYDALQDLRTELPDGTMLHLCKAVQTAPAHLGTDGNGRHEYSQNYETHIRNLTTHRE